MSSLPENLVFSVTDSGQTVRYMRYTSDDGQLRCLEDGIFQVTAKFAIEPTANGNVYIRSCFNNRYWVRTMESEYLYASAPEPEDEALFRPNMVSGRDAVSFTHVRSGQNVVMLPASDHYAYYITVGGTSAATQFSFKNYASLIKLAKYVMFKGDNDKYLTARTDPATTLPFHQFDLNGPTNSEVGFETVVTRTGDVRVKSRTFDKFWRSDMPASPIAWILGDYPADSDPNNPYTVFHLYLSSPSGGARQGVALRCRGNYLFCRRYVPFNGTYLATTMDSPSDNENHPLACLTVLNLGEPSKCRVTVTEFRQHRVYNTSSQELITSQVFENESDQEVTEDIIQDDPRRTTARTMKYSFSNSVTHGQGPANFFSRVPFVSEQGQVEMGEVVSLGLKSWGQTYDYTNNVNSAAVDVPPTVTVPAKTRVTATLLARTATCEFPISYTVVEEFYGGGGGTYSLHDGVFKGEYTYAFEVRVDKTEPLPPASAQD